MKEELLKFTVNKEEIIIEALKRIEANHQGFLIVVNSADEILGVLTDGDIRRAVIRGCTYTESVESAFTKSAKTVNVNDSFEVVAELFKNQAINFLPIADAEGKLVNVITKKQMHALLLQDIQANLDYDFLSLDTSVVDYEIFQRPWGFYKTTVLNDYYQGKIISVRPGGELSLQSHKHREEHWVVVHGNGTVQLDDSILYVVCGSSIFIPKGCKHRLVNTDNEDNLIITEVQIGDYLGEDDIIRYEDKYGRK